MTIFPSLALDSYGWVLLLYYLILCGVIVGFVVGCCLMFVGAGLLGYCLAGSFYVVACVWICCLRVSLCCCQGWLWWLFGFVVRRWWFYCFIVILGLCYLVGF